MQLPLHSLGRACSFLCLLWGRFMPDNTRGRWVSFQPEKVQQSFRSSSKFLFQHPQHTHTRTHTHTHQCGPCHSEQGQVCYYRHHSESPPLELLCEPIARAFLGTCGKQIFPTEIWHLSTCNPDRTSGQPLSHTDRLPASHLGFLSSQHQGQDHSPTRW